MCVQSGRTDTMRCASDAQSSRGACGDMLLRRLGSTCQTEFPHHASRRLTYIHCLQQTAQRVVAKEALRQPSATGVMQGDAVWHATAQCTMACRRWQTTNSLADVCPTRLSCTRQRSASCMQKLSDSRQFGRGAYKCCITAKHLSSCACRC